MLRPHVPLIAPSKYFKQYPLNEIQLTDQRQDHLKHLPKSVTKSLKFNNMTLEQQKKTIQAYYASISYMDAQIGRVLNALDRLKLRENTIVVFMSDHGYNLGEHTTWQKMSFWEDTTRVPLIISSPQHKSSSGKVCRDIVELIDLYPTLGDLSGKSNHLPDILEGESLRAYLENPNKIDSEQIAHTVMKKGTGSLRYQTWRYSKYPDGEQLYDLENDPQEFNNLAKNPEFATQLQLMRGKLETVQKK
jgi:arylsulfatase A-like enzyme